MPFEFLLTNSINIKNLNIKMRKWGEKFLLIMFYKYLKI